MGHWAWHHGLHHWEWEDGDMNGCMCVWGGWVLFTLTSFELDQSHSLVVM